MNEEDRKKAIEAVNSSETLALISIGKDGSRHSWFFPGQDKHGIYVIGGMEILKAQLIAHALKEDKAHA